MIRSVFVLVLGVMGVSAVAQKYSLEKANVSFFSHAAIEDITAENKKVSSIFNSESGEIVYSITINGFQFKKSLMQEHFNEKYMESDKYPKSTFQGKISGFDSNGKGVQQVKAAGKLTIHGVTRDVEIPGTIEKQDNKLVMKSKFMVKLEDYKITIPQLLWQNIAEQVEVTVDFSYKPQ
ncbi:YceI family protein [Fulvivirgaceae bacterium PWU4]|uniref:YceI family protein n=1 Tax=Chryseosolibacter histidini TaxID=2782349 RepID=A0AAP2DIP2_9BACT|nr:YceI family protein [Chryseosolibacter histidini]MBT1696900.1 YceI family protein [Chryseosolibacter histidini]